jgi:dUTPase
MSTLYIFTDNLELRRMLFDIENARRRTDSGFDIPMLHEHVNYNANNPMHTFNLGVKVAATRDNRPMPCLLLPRSSLAGSPYRLANSIGLIDSGYRGDVKAKVDIIHPGQYMVEDRTRLFQICQHNYLPWDHIEIVQFEHELPQPQDNRGAGGFGSTN